ncbi:MAG TPA: ribosome biogenesis GTP-binding protein YihA/YsxC [Steroidobacteraceae bacterium]|nr:ribosome biogenesis GTP-binding protein YihA/YsxC [Steroidobacteraceae bacterium]
MTRFARARFLLSAAAPEQFPSDRGVEIAFAGRSNAGKSSAINAILARRALARTSKTPGRTRLVNFFELEPERRVVDLPGYGFARVPQHERRAWAVLVDGLRARASFRGVFLIVDARRGIGAGDIELIDWADPARRAVHVLLTKSDELDRREGAGALAAARSAIAGCAGVQLFSAHTGAGVAEAQRLLCEWIKNSPAVSDEAAGAD